MNPITPTRFTPMQEQISHQVAGAVLEFPTEIADLIGQYADENVDADRPLAFDNHQNIIDSEDNLNIRAAMKRVLTSDSDPARKLLIFKNVQSVLDQHSGTENSALNYSSYGDAMNARITYIRYGDAMNALFDVIRAEGGRVNLDSVNFSDFHLSGYDLRGASMQGARFDKTTLTDMCFAGADFSEAHFERVLGQCCDFSGSTLTRSVWRNSSLVNSTLTRVDLSAALFYRAEFSLVFADGLISDDDQLNTIIASRSITDDGTEIAGQLKLLQVQTDRLKERLVDHRAREGLTSAHVLQSTYTTAGLTTLGTPQSTFQPPKVLRQ